MAVRRSCRCSRVSASSCRSPPTSSWWRAETRDVRRGVLPALILVALVMLAGCGTMRAKKASYYSDDGPPENVPSNLADLPDAVPRDEPYHRYANRPYTVFGKTY